MVLNFYLNTFVRFFKMKKLNTGASIRGMCQKTTFSQHILLEATSNSTSYQACRHRNTLTKVHHMNRKSRNLCSEGQQSCSTSIQNLIYSLELLKPVFTISYRLPTLLPSAVTFHRKGVHSPSLHRQRQNCRHVLFQGNVLP